MTKCYYLLGKKRKRKYKSATTQTEDNPTLKCSLYSLGLLKFENHAMVFEMGLAPPRRTSTGEPFVPGHS